MRPWLSRIEHFLAPTNPPTVCVVVAAPGLQALVGSPTRRFRRLGCCRSARTGVQEGRRDNVRVAQPDRAQDSWFFNWALRLETAQRICSKSGNATVRSHLADPEPSPARGRCRDWMGSTYGPRPTVKGQSRPRTPRGGGESRSGKNPGAVGSNPAADTISFPPPCTTAAVLSFSSTASDNAGQALRGFASRAANATR